MGRKKATAILPHLNDSGGDINKEWYVEYGYRNAATDKMERFRIYKGLNDQASLKNRYKVAQSIINDYEEKLKGGWNPFDDKGKRIIYEDETLYHNISVMYGRRKESNVNVRTYLSDFLAHKKSELRIKSYQTYQSKMRLFLAWLESKDKAAIDVSAIDCDMIETFLKNIVAEKKLSTATVAKYKQILHQFFNYLKRNKKLLISNPLENLPRIGILKDEAPDPINDRDRKILGQEIAKRDPQLWLACQLMYYSALRPGEEIRTMRIRQFNFATRSITVFITSAKNEQRESIRMSQFLFNELKKTYKMDSFPADWYVFSSGGMPGPTALGKNNMRMRFNRIRDDLGMPSEYKFYSWKHTGASALTATGINPFDLQHHLRHKDLNSTQKYIRKRFGESNEIITNKFPKI
jgi:integrase